MQKCDRGMRGGFQTASGFNTLDAQVKEPLVELSSPQVSPAVQLREAMQAPEHALPLILALRFSLYFITLPVYTLSRPR